MVIDNNAGAAGDGGGQAVERPAWLDSAPDAYKNNESFYGFKQPADFYAEMDSYLKAKGNTVVIPGEQATDEERKAFYSKIGVPESADKYELDDLKVEQYTAEADKMFRELMLGSNVPKSAAKGVHKAFVDMIQQGYEAQAKAEADKQQAEQQAVEAAVNTLKDTWKGEEFTVKSEQAHRAFNAVLNWAGIPEADAKAFVEGTKIGNLALGDHPVIMRMFAAIASKISDDSMAGGRGSGSGEQLSDEEEARKRFPNTKFKE